MVDICFQHLFVLLVLAAGSSGFQAVSLRDLLDSEAQGELRLQAFRVLGRRSFGVSMVVNV